MQISNQEIAARALGIRVDEILACGLAKVFVYNDLESAKVGYIHCTTDQSANYLKSWQDTSIQGFATVHSPRHATETLTLAVTNLLTKQIAFRCHSIKFWQKQSTYWYSFEMGDEPFCDYVAGLSFFDHKEGLEFNERIQEILQAQAIQKRKSLSEIQTNFPAQFLNEPSQMGFQSSSQIPQSMFEPIPPINPSPNNFSYSPYGFQQQSMTVNEPSTSYSTSSYNPYADSRSRSPSYAPNRMTVPNTYTTVRQPSPDYYGSYPRSNQQYKSQTYSPPIQNQPQRQSLPTHTQSNLSANTFVQLEPSDSPLPELPRAQVRSQSQISQPVRLQTPYQPPSQPQVSQVSTPIQSPPPAPPMPEPKPVSNRITKPNTAPKRSNVTINRPVSQATISTSPNPVATQTNLQPPVVNKKVSLDKTCNHQPKPVERGISNDAMHRHPVPETKFDPDYHEYVIKSEEKKPTKRKKFLHSITGMFQKHEKPKPSKRPNISEPSELQHVVGYSKDGFNVEDLPPSWKEVFTQAGITEEELRDKKTARFLMKGMGVLAQKQAEKKQNNVRIVKPQATPLREEKKNLREEELLDLSFEARRAMSSRTPSTPATKPALSEPVPEPETISTESISQGVMVELPPVEEVKVPSPQIVTEYHREPFREEPQQSQPIPTPPTIQAQEAEPQPSPVPHATEDVPKIEKTPSSISPLTSSAPIPPPAPPIPDKLLQVHSTSGIQQGGGLLDKIQQARLKKGVHEDHEQAQRMDTGSLLSEIKKCRLNRVAEIIPHDLEDSDKDDYSNNLAKLIMARRSAIEDDSCSEDSPPEDWE